MPIRLPRISRSAAALSVVAIAASGVLVSATAAQADTRSGDVTVTIPAKIVIDGGDIPVTVSSTSMYGSLDRVWANLYNGSALEGLEKVSPNTAAAIKDSLLTPGTIVATADLPQTDCDVYSDSRCHFDSDGDYVEFIDGLTFHDSAPSVAKYGSKVALSAVRDGRKAIWTASVSRYQSSGWHAWKDVVVTVGPKHLRTNSKGIATWIETASTQHAYRASVAETSATWGSTSAARKPAKAVQLSSSASASKAAAAIARSVDTVRKVVTITKRNDPNSLLGRSNGYTSAAVLFDSATTCSDGLGADCGATIEKFSSSTKASARKRYIQTLLKAIPALGTERDFVHNRFLLRVSGDLSSSSATAYKRAFLESFK